MYSGTLWVGTPHDLPTMGNGLPKSSKGWLPLYGAHMGAPGFWWLLLDRFNFFWRSNDTPIFIVERTSALSRADSRFAQLEEVLSDQQKTAWHGFRECLAESPGEVFLIELSGFWREEHNADAQSFELHMNSCFLPFTRSKAAWRKLPRMQKALLSASLFDTDTAGDELTGKILTALDG